MVVVEGGGRVVVVTMMITMLMRGGDDNAHLRCCNPLHLHLITVIRKHTKEAAKGAGCEGEVVRVEAR